MTNTPDEDVVARTIWGEARNQGRDGMVAVGCVIRNRVEADFGNDGKPDWWGEGWEGVCKAKLQFSCWNPGDPNLPKLRSVGMTDEKFRMASDIARGIIGGEIADNTAGADHYCTRAVAPTTTWAMNRKPVATIGAHLFYKLRPDPKGPKVVRESLGETRTMPAAAVAGSSATAGIALEQVKDVLTDALPQWPQYAKWITLALGIVTVLGVARIAWARFDDWRKGLR